MVAENQTGAGGDGQDALINVRLKQIHLKNGLKLTPRRYQTELYLEALNRNVIIYLGTGLGKTFITVLFLNSPSIDELVQQGRKVVFMAPTQDLIKQQAQYINCQVRYRVKLFCGRSAHCGEHIDHWDKQVWDQELEHIDILFMTPQIFSSAVCTNRLSWLQFSAVIFDEFHHACRTSKTKESGHPYAQILRHYQSFYSIRPATQFKPRIIGLTASLINSMPKDRECIESEIQHLEKIIEGRCITDILVQDMRPNMVVQDFLSFELNEDNDLLISMLKKFKNRMDDALKTMKVNKLLKRKAHQLTQEQEKVLSFHNRLKLASMGFSIKPGSFPKVLDGLANIRQRCGLWALGAICFKLVEALEKNLTSPFMTESIRYPYMIFTAILKKIQATLHYLLSTETKQGLFVYTRPKSMALLDLLRQEYENIKNDTSDKAGFNCIVFVRSRLEVVALNQWIQTLSSVCPEYHFIKCNYAIGLAATMSSKYSCITKRKTSEQSAMLEDFRNEVLNVIITTSVLEEGIDLPVCSTVIRYDSPNNFREYVQSRGRARQKVSSFVSLCECPKVLDTIETLNKFNDFEITLKEILRGKNVGSAPVRSITHAPASPLDREDFFETEDKLVFISASTARVILHMYCSRLSKHTPFASGIQYESLEPTAETFQTVLYLPSGCPINGGITGAIKSSERLADNSAIVAAIRALYEAKELDSFGVPTRVNRTNVDNLLSAHNLEPKFEALTKRQEGLRVTEGEKEIVYFEPKVRRLNTIVRGPESRKLKLIKLIFEPDPETSRQDTRRFFHTPTYGMIIDSSTKMDFVPTKLHSHYGIFRVRWALVTDSFSVSSDELHKYLNYTHKFLTRCLSIRGIKRDDELRHHCLFFMVPLDPDDRPDFLKMQKSFTELRTNLKVNDIVKLRYFYSNNTNRRDPTDEGRLMLVRAIRDDMNAHSFVPNMRNTTFLSAANYKYGQGVVRNFNQKVIEVAHLSKDFAMIKEVKRRDKNYRTDSVFYLEQFLEHFDDDASCVFQAFNMPEIIYRLYLASTAATLDKKFVTDTQNRRYAPSNLRDESPKDPDEETIEKEASKSVGVEPETEEPIDELSGDDSDVGSADESLESDDTEYSDDGLLVSPQYRDMVSKRSLDLDNDDRDHMKRWDMSEYRVPDLKRMNFERRTYVATDCADESRAQFHPAFIQLIEDIAPLEHKLIDWLENFELKMTADSTFLNADDEFQKRDTRVDRSIAPPVTFGRNFVPMKRIDREWSLLEALTLCRAQESYNLERLEHLGDSYLKYVISVVLHQNLEGSEGFLTSARSRLTCNEYFTHLAKLNELGSFAITSPFSKDYFAFVLGKRINEEAMAKVYNRMRPKDLADVFESIVGSLLSSCGEFEAVLAIEWLGLRVFKDSTFDYLNQKSVVFAPAPSALIDGDSDLTKEFYRASKKKFVKFQEVLGYTFEDPSFLVQAFTHASSYQKCTRSYERLEFLGDAILDFLVTYTLISASTNSDPGQLTSSRSALVNNSSFARIALKYTYDLFIQHCSHELYDELTKVRAAAEEDPSMEFLDMTSFDQIVKLLGDVFESVAGAIYLDSGCSLDAVWSVYYPMLKESIDQEIRLPTKNLLATLYETYPGKGRITFESYDVKSEDGDLIGVRCRILCAGPNADALEFEGQGLTKRQAKLRAVREATKQLPSAELKADLNAIYLKKTCPRDYRARPSRGGRARPYQGRERSYRITRNRN